MTIATNLKKKLDFKLRFVYNRERGEWNEVHLLRPDGKPGGGFQAERGWHLDPPAQGMRDLRPPLHHIRKGRGTAAAGDQEG